MESVEGTGRNVDEAVENALDELGLERDEVEISVLDDGSAGGAARVLVTALEPYDEDELDEEDDELVDEDELVEEPVRPRAAVAPVAPATGATEAGVTEAGAGQPVDVNAIAALAEQTLGEMLDRMDLPSEVVVDEAIVDDGLPAVELSVHGEFGGILIGRHGETLSALQFLLGLITSRRAGRRVRVVVDVEGYRERREKLLREMALRAADRAQRYRQPIFMDPMTPGERRVVHLALQDHPTVTTHSVGEGDSRRVVVSPKQAQRFGGFGVE